MTTTTFLKAYPLLAMQGFGDAAAGPLIESSFYTPVKVASSLPLATTSVTEIVAGLPSMGGWGIGALDVLSGLEDLVSADVRWAVELLGDVHARQAASLICTVLGTDGLSEKRDVYEVAVDLLDAGMSLLELSGAVMRLPIWGLLANEGSSDASALQIADYLLTTVIGHAPDTDVLDQALSLLIDHPPGEFLWQLAESVADQIEIDLVGLVRSALDIF